MFTTNRNVHSTNKHLIFMCGYQLTNWAWLVVAFYRARSRGVLGLKIRARMNRQMPLVYAEMVMACSMLRLQFLQHVFAHDFSRLSGQLTGLLLTAGRSLIVSPHYSRSEPTEETTQRCGDHEVGSLGSHSRYTPKRFFLLVVGVAEVESSTSGERTAKAISYYRSNS